jgi:hypothetical protein
LRQDLLAYFETKRMVTSSVRVVDPDYVALAIEGTLTVNPRYAKDQVRQRAEDAILALWSFEQVDFGETLYLSKAYEVIQEIEGVEGVNITIFSAGGVGSADGKLTFGPAQIPQLKFARGINFTSVDIDG